MSKSGGLHKDCIVTAKLMCVPRDSRARNQARDEYEEAREALSHLSESPIEARLGVDQGGVHNLVSVAHPVCQAIYMLKMLRSDWRHRDI